MFSKLFALKLHGYTPDVVLDIGAFHGLWTNSMREIFADARYFLFEAIKYPELNSFDNVFNVLLNDKAEEVTWFEMRNTGDSMFREKTVHFKNCNIIKRQSVELDTVIAETDILQTANNIFIKIDCQGAEMPILKGAKSLYLKTAFILLELPLFGQYNAGVPTFVEHLAFMDSIGFVPFDIVDNHYFNGFNMQVDVLFINKSHAFNARVNELLL